MSSMTRRALHFVFKVADRTSTISFYRNVLGMKVLRHEEFEEGCKAACNGPYDGKWSKTMMGFGSEDCHFVVELTYNYGIKKYKLGNDFQYISIFSKPAYGKAELIESSIKEKEGVINLPSPGGYTYKIYNQDPLGNDPVQCVCLGVSSLSDSIKYWDGLLGMKLYSREGNMATFGYADDQAKLVLNQLSEPLKHEDAYGRIAFSCPSTELPSIQEKVSKAGNAILTPLVSLDTPGKATVEVVILGDPDGHEICFVGDEAFRELSKIDSKSDQLLDEAMSNDRSVEWFEAKERKRQLKTET